MILFSHPTGNANVRHAALGLEEAGLLAEYWTCVGWNPESTSNRFLPARVRSELSRRALPERLRSRAHYRPWREMGRLASVSLGFASWLHPERGRFGIDTVYRDLDRAVARRLCARSGLQGVYAYEDGASATFKVAAERGLRCFYDLPIGYWRAAHALYAEEKVREPDWASTLTGVLDSPEKLARKDEELAQANVVLVASSFTKSTLALSPFPIQRIEVVPYGAPASLAVADTRFSSPRLRILFAGSLTQRKGLSYLLTAFKMLRGPAKLTLIGRKPVASCWPLEEALRQHRWIPSLPHAEILREMRQHDVLVFPSLFEGFGLVITEALSQGLPVITTTHTAGPDFITEGENGFIVPIRSAEGIAHRLDQLASNPDLLAHMRQAAQRSAARKCWLGYGRQVAKVVETGLHVSRDEYVRAVDHMP